MSSRSNSAMKVTGRPLSSSRKSSVSHCSSSSTPICRVSATSIAPLFFSFSTFAYAFSSSRLGIAAGERPPAETQMLVQDRAGEAECAGVHRLARAARGSSRFPPPSPRAPSTPRPSRSGGGASAAPGSRGSTRRLAARRGVHVFGEALPVPGDALGSTSNGIASTLTRSRIATSRDSGSAGRDSHAAVAHHHAGHAVPRRRRHRAIPADLRVVVRVRIDEARRNNAIRRVDRLPCRRRRRCRSRRSFRP